MLLWDWSLCSLGLAADSNLRSVLIALNTFCTLELILSGLFSKLITDMNSCSRREWTIALRIYFQDLHLGWEGGMFPG